MIILLGGLQGYIIYGSGGLQGFLLLGGLQGYILYNIWLRWFTRISIAQLVYTDFY